MNGPDCGENKSKAYRQETSVQMGDLVWQPASSSKPASWLAASVITGGAAGLIALVMSSCAKLL
jgi:hypothetical protein